ncbi:amino acid permease-associated region [Kalymmatonema gypsitolerans NIES-4073]|nr:amino acid permease-associated region [Scytonema sp. NIES-4073]
MGKRTNYPLPNTVVASKVAPQGRLSLKDAIALIVGVVIGAGIFETPSLVAANVESPTMALFVWLLGGAMSLIGALCYAELATAYPHVGGNYHYLMRAFGKNWAFLFAWARMTVIQTGSIALLAFMFGDYISQLWRLGDYSPSIYAAGVIVIFTVVNIIGIQQGKSTQKWLTVATILGLVLVIIAGLVFTPPPVVSAAPTSQGNFGLAMVFVLLSYGGWNEAAYISAELQNTRRNMVRSLLWSIGIITAIYLLINIAYITGLGLSGMAQQEAVAASLMRRAFGEPGAVFISLLVAVATLGGINATIFTGARSNYALGQDFALFSFMGDWRNRSSTPTKAMLVQSAITLFLVLFGTLTRKGFETMVDYTAPVFWFFFLLSGVSLLVLRVREPHVFRPFRVPFYPLTPILFCLICGYLLYSSLAYTGVGALAGVAVVLAGVPLLFLANHRQS